MGFGPSLAPTVSTAVGCTLRLVRTNFNAERTDLKVHRTSLKAWLKCCGVDRERERERVLGLPVYLLNSLTQCLYSPYSFKQTYGYRTFRRSQRIPLFTVRPKGQGYSNRR